MSTNIEIKARVSDLLAIRRLLRALDVPSMGVLKHHDTFYWTPIGRLKYRRVDGMSFELIFYLRDDTGGPKKSTYFRLRVSRKLMKFLAPLGRIWPKKGDVLNVRELYLLHDTRVHLDTVASLGTFLELEVVLKRSGGTEYGVEKVASLLNALHIEEDDLISGAYVDLLEESSNRKKAPSIRGVWG